MKKKRDRIIYQNWIVKLGRDPELKIHDVIPPPPYNEVIIAQVNDVIDSLDSDEADFMRRFYLQGMTYLVISDLTGRAVYRLEALHSRALKKFRNRLGDFLSDSFEIKIEIDSRCPLCDHPHHQEINSLIQSKPKEETWKKIITTLKIKYQLKIGTPQILIGHAKYHIG